MLLRTGLLQSAWHLLPLPCKTIDMLLCLLVLCMPCIVDRLAWDTSSALIVFTAGEFCFCSVMASTLICMSLDDQG